MSSTLFSSTAQAVVSRPSFGVLGLCTILVTVLTGCGDQPTTPRAAPVDAEAEAGAPAAIGPAPPRPDVLVLVLDSLRADRMGGALRREDDRDLTPTLDGIGRSGLNAVLGLAPSPHTAPSFASLLSGLSPLSHGVRNAENGTHSVLPSDVRTFPELLKAAGWSTTLVHESGQILQGGGFFQGFDLVAPTSGLEGTARALDTLLATADVDVPHCVVVHSYAAHVPFLPPRDHFGIQYRGRYTEAPEGGATRGGRFRERQELLENFEGNRKGRAYAELAEGFLEPYEGMTDDDVVWLRDLYDENLAWVDAQVAELLNVWSDHRSYPDSMIVLTSGHGLALGDGGRFGVEHGLSGATMHVPFAIAGPGVAPGALMSAVSTVTLPATLLDLCGLRPPPAMESSLGSMLGVRGLRDDLKIARVQSPATREFGVAWMRYVVLQRPDEQGRSYYDFFLDPMLSEPVELDEPLAERLDKIYASLIEKDRDPARAHRPQSAPLPPRARQGLRVLGYVQ